MRIRHRDVADRDQYSFDCPVGTWRGRLDAKAWGKKSNVLLYFSELETGRQFALSVYWTNGHQPREGGIDFRTEAEPGQIFELETGRTSSGWSKLISAKTDEPSAGRT